MADPSIIPDSDENVEMGPDSMLGKYVKSVKELQEIVGDSSRNATDDLSSAARKFGQPLEKFQKLFDNGRFVGKSTELPVMLKKFAVQKEIVLQMQNELKTQVEAHVFNLKKVTDNLHDMFGTGEKEEMEPPTKVQCLTETKQTNLDKRTGAISSILEYSYQRHYGLDFEVDLKNISQTVTFYCKVSHHEKDCELQPEAKIRGIAPGDTFRFKLCHFNHYLRLRGSKGCRHGQQFLKNHTVEIAYSTKLAGDQTIWNFFWLPYETDWAY